MDLPLLSPNAGRAERAQSMVARACLLSVSTEAEAAHAESEPPLPSPKRQPSDGSLPIERERVVVKIPPRPIHSERRTESEAAHAEAIAHTPNARVSADGAPSRIGRYELLGELGRGVRSVVYKAVEDGKVVALKIIKTRGSPVDRQRVRREVEVRDTLRVYGDLSFQLQRRLKHRNIVKIIDSFDVEDGVGVALQLAPNQDLLDRINKEGPLDEKAAARIFQELYSAIDYAHSQHIVHRDLKPENVLFDGDTALVCDWGQACEWRKGQTRSHFACGTDGYKAPELHFQTPYEGPELDVWGLGVILYVMVTKHLPYGDTPPRPSVCSSNEAGLVLPLELSTPLCNLLSAMLVPAVRLRATLRTVAQSQWFKSMCTSPVSQLPPPPDELLYSPGEGEGSAWATLPRRSINAVPVLPPSAVLFVSGDEG